MSFGHERRAATASVREPVDWNRSAPRTAWPDVQPRRPVVHALHIAPASSLCARDDTAHRRGIRYAGRDSNAGRSRAAPNGRWSSEELLAVLSHEVRGVNPRRWRAEPCGCPFRCATPSWSARRPGTRSRCHDGFEAETPWASGMCLMAEPVTVRAQNH